VPESRSGEAATTLVRHTLVVSDFAMSEFSSGIARRARMGEFSGADAAVVFARFDAWLPGAARREELATADVGCGAWIWR
jgi:hypothetical protein